MLIEMTKHKIKINAEQNSENIIHKQKIESIVNQKCSIAKYKIVNL